MGGGLPPHLGARWWLQASAGPPGTFPLSPFPVFLPSASIGVACSKGPPGLLEPQRRGGPPRGLVSFPCSASRHQDGGPGSGGDSWPSGALSQALEQVGEEPTPGSGLVLQPLGPSPTPSTLWSVPSVLAAPALQWALLAVRAAGSGGSGPRCCDTWEGPHQAGQRPPRPPACSHLPKVAWGSPCGSGVGPAGTTWSLRV